MVSTSWHSPVRRVLIRQCDSNAGTEDGALYSWGLNDFGQLGTGDTTSREEPTHLTFFADKQVKHVIAGMEHTVVITEDV